MPRPSTVRRPSRQAARNKGVSRGVIDLIADNTIRAEPLPIQLEMVLGQAWY